MKYVPDNVEEVGLKKVFSFIWSSRRKEFFRFSSFLQLYLVLSLVCISIKVLFFGVENILSFLLSFGLPVILSYGILHVIYVILYVDVIRLEKEKRKENLQRILNVNP